jgi:signal transduction histidine kinase
LLTELTASRTTIAVAREHERAQLRHDLHDRLGSQLTGLRLQLDTLETRTADAALARDAHKASEEAQRALDEVRRISRGLRPAELDELGLRAAVASAAERLSVGTGDWTATVDAALHLPPIPKTVSSAAYHVVVEALTNARRHSEGTKAHVRIGISADGNHLVLEVSDNGRGFNGEPREGVGLQSMRERVAATGGALEVTTGSSGVTIRAQLPLEDTDAMADTHERLANG